MLKGYIKTLSSSPKMYKENCLLMQIAKVLSPTADCSNAHRYKSAITGIRAYMYVHTSCHHCRHRTVKKLVQSVTAKINNPATS